MSTRNAVGWQTMLADLSLILFMVTAAAMAEPPPKAAAPQAMGKPVVKPAPPPAKPAPTLYDPARAQPLSVWREAPDGADIAAWLASQQIDARQQLTITLRYPPGGQGRAMADAQRLTGAAGPHGARARIIMEAVPQGPPEVLASLAYDQPGIQ